VQDGQFSGDGKLAGIGRSVYGNHYVRGFDDRENRFPLFQPQIPGGTLGDDRNDFHPSGHLQGDLRIHGSVDEFFHLSLQHIPGADFHCQPPSLGKIEKIIADFLQK
jgi:hypothetical protein